MKAFYLATTLILATSGAAMASETTVGSGLSTVSSEAQSDVSLCLADDSSSRAVRACTKAIRASAPNDGVRAHLYTRRALHRMALGRFDDASNDFSRAGDLKGDASLANLGEGFAAMMDDDLTTAKSKFQDCETSSSVASLAAYGLGLTHQKAGNAEDARAAYEQALTLRPGWDAVIDQMATLQNR